MNSGHLLDNLRDTNFWTRENHSALGNRVLIELAGHQAPGGFPTVSSIRVFSHGFWGWTSGPHAITRSLQTELSHNSRASASSYNVLTAVGLALLSWQL